LTSSAQHWYWRLFIQVAVPSCYFSSAPSAKNLYFYSCRKAEVTCSGSALQEFGLMTNDNASHANNGNVSIEREEEVLVTV